MQKRLGCEPFICGNLVRSAGWRKLADWLFFILRYCSIILWVKYIDLIIQINGTV